MKTPRLSRLDAAVLAVSAVAALLFALGTVVLASGGGAVVNPMGGQIGDLVMQEAIRFETAEMIPEAVGAYKKAVAGKFDVPVNRLHALRRLGLLTLKTDGPEAALPYLAESAAGDNAPPDSYQALCNVFVTLGRYEEAIDAAQRWVARAEALKVRPDQAAYAWLALGNAHKGAKAYDDALAAFEKGRQADPLSQNSYEAAAIYCQQGKLDEAASVLEAFLKAAEGANVPASRVSSARGLLKKCGGPQA